MRKRGKRPLHAIGVLAVGHVRDLRGPRQMAQAVQERRVVRLLRAAVIGGRQQDHERRSAGGRDERHDTIEPAVVHEPVRVAHRGGDIGVGQREHAHHGRRRHEPELGTDDGRALTLTSKDRLEQIPLPRP